MHGLFSKLERYIRHIFGPNKVKKNKVINTILWPHEIAKLEEKKAGRK